MSTPTSSSGSINVHVSSHSSLIDNMQEITLRAALSRAVDLMADCFDNCNRKAETGSVFSKQAQACDENYAAVGSHKTTLIYTENLTKHLIYSGLDYLRGAIDATLNTSSVVGWSSLPLTRSLIEASADCLWLADPTLNLDTRLRRTSQMFVRACGEMLRILPDTLDGTPRFLSIDPDAKPICLEARNAALEWAKAQGWTCARGKSITPTRWVAEIPSHTEAVALAAQGTPDYWKDVYRMLSGATHSQPLLMTLSLSAEPESILDRAFMVLDIGVSFYTDALKKFAEFMGWNDHDIDDWFAPVHLAIEHIRTPEEIPLPSFNLEQCDVCPEYQELFLHRLAFASHLCALMELNVDGGNTAESDAPARYAAAIDYFNRLHETLMTEAGMDSNTHDMRTALGSAHTGVLTLFGSNLREVLTSIAASWAILRSPSYQSGIGKIQGWLSASDDQSPTPPKSHE